MKKSTTLDRPHADYTEAVGAFLWNMSHEELTEWAVANLRPDALQSIVDKAGL